MLGKLDAPTLEVANHVIVDDLFEAVATDPAASADAAVPPFEVTNAAV